MLQCQDCSFFPLICWGFCSKKLCTPEPYYKLEVSRKELLFALFYVCLFPLFSFGNVVGLHTTSSEYYSALFLWNAKPQVVKGVTHDSTVSLPLYYLNRCVFVAPALTGTPPHWFISPVGLLAAAGDQTDEPRLSHQGNESEKRGGEEHFCLSAASLCSQAALFSHLFMPHMHPISALTKCIALKTLVINTHILKAPLLYVTMHLYSGLWDTI